MSLIEKLNWRYATKKFDPAKKLSAEQLDNLLNAVQLSPSSYGLQPYKVIVVTDPAIRQQLKEAGYGQQQIADASQVIVFATETSINEALVKHFIDVVAASRQVDRALVKGYEDMMNGSLSHMTEDQKIVWGNKQTYIALGILLTAAAELGIDACPMEGFQPGKFDEILGLKEKGLSASVIACIGFRAEDDDYAHLAKVRRPKEELFIHI